MSRPMRARVRTLATGLGTALGVGLVVLAGLLGSAGEARAQATDAFMCPAVLPACSAAGGATT